MNMPPKFLPTLTEVVVVDEPPSGTEQSASASVAAHVDEQARVLSELEVARLEQQLVQSHWLEQRLTPALREWVEHELAHEVALQVERLAPVWAKALAEGVSTQVMARIPGIVDRLLQEAAPTTPNEP